MNADIQAAQKQAAAEKALGLVQSGMCVGLGTGSTAYFVVEGLGRRLRDGTLTDITGIPTSERTDEHARRVGIPLAALAQKPNPDITIDGADEVAPDLSLIKGLGGALLREKIVAGASRRMVVVVDETKIVEKLGLRGPVPIEVIPFGWETIPDKIRKLGGEAVLRAVSGGKPFITDGGHYILDCRWPAGLSDPGQTDADLKKMVGIVETGLFVGMASTIFIAGRDGVRVLSKDKN